MAQADILNRNNVPFAALLADRVDAASATLAATVGDTISPLTDAALAVLEQALLVRLSSLSLAVFTSEFGLFRALHPILPGQIATAPDAQYREFVEAMQSGRAAEVLCHYAGLAALLDTVTADWVAAQREMLVRLATDWPALCDRFGMTGATPAITAISPYRSDPHHHGRSVAMLAFADGGVLVYKPRSLAMDAAWDALLGWANALGPARAFYRPALLSRDGYGWMAPVAANPCETADQLDDCYHRSGGIACLVALCQGTDIHHENLIAAGDQPVIVDAETLLQPRLDRAFSSTLGAGAQRRAAPDTLAFALAESGLLPRPGEIDFSGLGASGSVVTPFLHPVCQNVNSDAMTVAHIPYRAAPQGNVPILAGAAAGAAKNVEAICAGFADMLATLLANRRSLRDLIESWRGLPTRLVVRSTNAYGMMLNASTHPALLRDAGARDAHFAQLYLGTGPRTPTAQAIIDAELSAMRRMDVPHLTRPCDAGCEGWPSPLDQVLARIDSLDATDLAECLSLFRKRLADAQHLSIEPAAPEPILEGALP